MPLDRPQLLDLLAELGRRATSISSMEITLVGGSAGILTGQLPPSRATIDCDVAGATPAEQLPRLIELAGEVARERGLPENWFSAEVAQLNVLPDGWRRRRIEVGVFGTLAVWCVGRLDLLATKVYAGRMQDRADVLEMKPTAEELQFIRRYLHQLRVPSRQANLDQIESALRFVHALEAPPG